MGNLLFSPSGRIDSASFMKGATLLIIVGVVLGLLPLLSPALAALGIIGLVTIWCWVVLWVKRYHDAGQSGWKCLIPIVLYIIAALVVTTIMTPMFTDAVVAEAMAEAEASGDIGALMSAAMAGGGITKMGTLIITLVSAAISYGIAFLFNNMIKSDPHDNQFGPAT